MAHERIIRCSETTSGLLHSFETFWFIQPITYATQAFRWYRGSVAGYLSRDISTSGIVFRPFSANRGGNGDPFCVSWDVRSGDWCAVSGERFESLPSLCHRHAADVPWWFLFLLLLPFFSLPFPLRSMVAASGRAYKSQFSVNCPHDQAIYNETNGKLY